MDEPIIPPLDLSQPAAGPGAIKIKHPKAARFTPEYREQVRLAQHTVKVRRLSSAFMDRPTWQRNLLTVLVIVFIVDQVFLTPFLEGLSVGMFGQPGWGLALGKVLGQACIAGMVLVLTLHGPWLLFKKARVGLAELFVVLNILGVLFGFGAQFIQAQDYKETDQIIWAYGGLFVISVNWIMRGAGWGFWAATILEINQTWPRFRLALMGILVPACLMPYIILLVRSHKRLDSTIWLVWVALTIASIFSFIFAREYHSRAKQKEAIQEVERELSALKEKRLRPKEET